MLSHVLLSLCLLPGSPALRVSADEPTAEVAQLRARVQQLEAINKRLSDIVTQFQDELHKIPGGKAESARLATYERYLYFLDKRLQEKPDDVDTRREAAELARSLASESRGNRLVWEVLVETGVLKNGITLEEAKKLLGPPTEQSNQHVGWYFNPRNMHVAPYLHAAISEQGLTNWKFGLR